MAKNNQILITGATGAVGPVVVNAIHDSGYSLRSLSMDPVPVGLWPDNVDARIGDRRESN
jgi:UDP-glucose 4-epimerase